MLVNFLPTPRNPTWVGPSGRGRGRVLMSGRGRRSLGTKENKKGECLELKEKHVDEVVHL